MIGGRAGTQTLGAGRGARMPNRSELEAAILKAKADASAAYQLASYYDGAAAPESAGHAREVMDDALDRLTNLWLKGTP